MTTLPFRNLYRHGFARVAVATPAVRPADPAFNVTAIADLAAKAHAAGAAVAAFPELAISGYAIDDLHLQAALLDAAETALSELVSRSRTWRPALVVGAPVRWRNGVYNCAVVLQGGRILGVVPKTYLPNYREYYEKRWFESGAGVVGAAIRVAGAEVPFGTDLLFASEGVRDLVIGVEVCEDLWAPVPPSTFAALAGATVLVNLSASNITIGKARERGTLCLARSAACNAAYLYAAAGPGESTTDVAWDGQAGVYENGRVVAEGERFPTAPALVVADIDLELLAQERLRLPTFRDAARVHGERVSAFRRVAFAIEPPQGELTLSREVARFPYVPNDPARLDADCYEAYNIQVFGLMKRLEASGAKTAVIGVSGGLDSTHALIVTAKTFDLMGRPRSAIRAFTMPGFATGEASKAAAWKLMRALGVTAEELDIRPAATQMLADLGHPFANGEPAYDVTFENVQAGLRTDYLFRLANRHDGLVIGTGDLSELALGWCTYGVGDQMSHYGVNSGVPKTLIQQLIAWCARTGRYDATTAAALEEILAAEISPELVPAQGGQAQSTEAAIGPYALHDFTLYHTLRYGMRPSRIAFLAEAAWGDPSRGGWPPGTPARDRRGHDLAEITRWMDVFYRRFFANQFKRSALPNGPKVVAGGALSPRGDWRMPSDASANAWLADLKSVVG